MGMLYTDQTMMERDFQSVMGVLREAPDTAALRRTTLMAVIHLIEASAFETLSQYMTEDIEMHIAGTPIFAGSWYGYRDVTAAIAANFSKVTGQKPVIESMIQQDQVIAVRIRETGRIIATGEEYAVRGVLWFEFEDALIRRIDEVVA